MFYENFNLINIVTPVKAECFIKLLKKADYNPQEIQYLQEGFTEGFGYTGPQARQSRSDNIPLKPGIGDKTVLWNKLMKEVSLKWVAGPFKDILLDNFIQSPIGLVPKKGCEQTRLIFHLLYDFNRPKEDGNYSLNKHTPREICTVRYHDLDFVVHSILKKARIENKTDKWKI